MYRSKIWTVFELRNCEKERLARLLIRGTIFYNSESLSNKRT